MGRKVNHSAAAAVGPLDTPYDAPAAAQGGTPGVVIPEASQVVFDPSRPQRSVVGEERPDEPKPRRYQVTNPMPLRILFNGVLVDIRPGKILDDVSYDIEYLRKRGVRLQEIAE